MMQDRALTSFALHYITIIVQSWIPINN